MGLILPVEGEPPELPPPLKRTTLEWGTRGQLIELHKQGLFPYDQLLTFYEMEHIDQAIADFESGTVVNPVMRM